jgi:hydrogenase maturation protease
LTTDAAVSIRVRFLQPVSREVGLLPKPLEKLDRLPDAGAFQIVPEVRIDGKLYQSWQEAIERELSSGPASVSTLCERAEPNPFCFPPASRMEAIHDGAGLIPAFLLWRHSRIEGFVDVAAERLDDEVFKLTVSCTNVTQTDEGDLKDDTTILPKVFASTHTILETVNAEFISLLDPPPDCLSFAEACSNNCSWPVLIGERGGGRSSDTMLSSPIILYDYPQIAAQSPGELFDGTEIDEILTLRVLTMTDDEKSEMRQLDEKTRKLLERTEALSDHEILALHAQMQDLESSGGGIFEADARPKNVVVQGVELRVGDLVTIRPKGRADVMDIALDGKAAVIESIEQDAEGRHYLALVLDDDPGKDLGFMRQPGHRFFYGPHEVEPLRRAG